MESKLMSEQLIGESILIGEQGTLALDEWSQY